MPENKMNIRELMIKNTEYTIMVHVDCRAAIELIEYLYFKALLLDSTSVKFCPPFTSCSTYRNGEVKPPSTICLEFVNQSWVPDHVITTLKLLGLLAIYDAHMCVKMSDKGYEVSQNGTIIREWELDDDMS
jgi:hypothetical protein